jgi:threonine/homoserine efflux transporter RhtA
MNLQVTLAPILALLAGILILVQPKLLNFIVAIYLIVIGVLGLLGASGMSLG